MVRNAFVSLVGFAVDDSQWGLASRGLGSGGLGLRKASGLADAAYASSRLATSVLCKALDAAFVDGDLDLVTSVDALNATVSAPSAVSLERIGPVQQQALSKERQREKEEFDEALKEMK